jgi:hypothetical protein
MRLQASWLDRLKTRSALAGPLTLAAFTLCAVSGLPLLFVYRPGAPLESLALALMENPIGAWVRSVHYWSAQCFLVCAILYLLGCLARREDTRETFGNWLRLILVGPVIFFALLSGFILRGDGAAEELAAVVRNLLQVIPPGGKLLAQAMLGPEASLTVIFWHHVATTTVVFGLLFFVRFGRLLPKPVTLGWALLVVVVLSAWWVPGLGAYPAAAKMAPWYAIGMQEILRWIPEPGLVVGLGLSAVLALALLPVLGTTVRKAALWSLTVGLFAYIVLTVTEFARLNPSSGENARSSLPARSGFVSARTYLPAKKMLRDVPVATVAGRPEGCLSCHRDMTGFSPVHSPTAIGCSSCHLGNPFTLDSQLAHTGMTLTPGSLSIVHLTCATAGCHADVAARVHATLMNTMSGVVAVDKVVFGESHDLNRQYDVGHLGASPADGHLRHLCASCHLGQDKLQPAAIDQQSRGGGCSACHLVYGPEALAELRRRRVSDLGAHAPVHHPDISTSVPANACFGCHSRSGRISTNYEGWHETQIDPTTARQSADWAKRYRVLEDGRVLARQAADVHFEKGMICTDCHLASEVMGDGAAHAHEATAVKIACTDCHSEQPPATATFTELDPETQKLVALRQPNQEGRRFVRAQGGKIGYPNTFLDETGGVILQTASGAALKSKPPARVCGRDILAHQKLECRTCHSAWAPQCISCHTSFEPKQEGWDHLAGRYVRGTWQETGKDYRADPPVLGVATVPSAAGLPIDRVSTFVPGMVMTLNKTMGAGKLPDEFHRLYAPADPHTIVTQARDCLSCHANSLALGYGRGVLKYHTRDGRGHWEFAPTLSRSPYDGLPVDAWIGFMEEPKAPAATRTNVRPFNRREQQRMLLVGACLQCHSDKEPRIADVFNDFSRYRTQLSPKCILPDWED